MATNFEKEYLGNKTFGQVVRKPGDSHFWSGLMKVKDLFLANGMFKVNNGHATRFWEDKWLGNFTLQHKYPSLYNIVRYKHTTVATVLGSVPLNVSFRRGLQGENLGSWYALVNRVAGLSLNPSKDTFRWSLHQNGKFSSQSMYAALIGREIPRQETLIWKLRIPLKIKIFCWFLTRGVILTKDNLIKRKWNGSKKCVFCSHDETIPHLFFDCHYARFLWRSIYFTFGIREPTSLQDMGSSWLQGFNKDTKAKIYVGAIAICWALWLSRNDVVFDKNPIQTYLQVLFRGTYWCRFWGLLQKREEDTIRIKDACRVLEATTMQIFAMHGWSFRNRLTNS